VLFRAFSFEKFGSLERTARLCYKMLFLELFTLYYFLESVMVRAPLNS